MSSDMLILHKYATCHWWSGMREIAFICEVVAKPLAHLVGSRVPRDRGRAGRASLPGFATASCNNLEC